MGQIVVAGNALANQVLAGATFSGGNLYNFTGTMPNNGVLNYTPSASAQTIPAGYTSGGTVAAVTVPAANVKAGTTIAGVAGTMADFAGLSKDNTSISSSVGGDLYLFTPPGYYNASSSVHAFDSNYQPAKIPLGTTLFGMAGTLVTKSFQTQYKSFDIANWDTYPNNFWAFAQYVTGSGYLTEAICYSPTTTAEIRITLDGVVVLWSAYSGALNGLINMDKGWNNRSGSYLSKQMGPMVSGSVDNVAPSINVPNSSRVSGTGAVIAFPMMFNSYCLIEINPTGGAGNSTMGCLVRGGYK